MVRQMRRCQQRWYVYGMIQRRWQERNAGRDGVQRQRYGRDRCVRFPERTCLYFYFEGMTRSFSACSARLHRLEAAIGPRQQQRAFELAEHQGRDQLGFVRRHAEVLQPALDLRFPISRNAPRVAAPSTSDCAEVSSAVVAIGQPSLKSEFSRSAAMPRAIRARNISAVSDVSGAVRDAPDAWPRRRASARSRRSAPCRSESGNKASPAATRPRPECRAARCRDNPAGETASPRRPVFSLWNQKLWPCSQISVANRYVDLHNM